MVIFLFNTSSFGKAPFQRVLFIPSTHMIYTHAILTPDVIWPFCCRWTLQAPPQMKMKSRDFKYRISAPKLNLMMTDKTMQKQVTLMAEEH